VETPYLYIKAIIENLILRVNRKRKGRAIIKEIRQVQKSMTFGENRKSHLPVFDTLRNSSNDIFRFPTDYLTEKQVHQSFFPQNFCGTGEFYDKLFI
jgi:hypothetical protein